MSDPYSTLGLSCPSGGKFYICAGNTTEFIGCCTSNPCTSSGGGGSCPTFDLRNSSFNSDSYVQIGAQDCSNSNAHWYTCSDAKPPFLGCCTENPCNDGCPNKNLAPAKLSANATLRQAFLDLSEGMATTMTASTGRPKGAKVGGIVGGILGGTLIILAVVLIWWYRRHRKSEGKKVSTRNGSLVFLPKGGRVPKVGSPESLHLQSRTPPSQVGSSGNPSPGSYPVRNGMEGFPSPAFSSPRFQSRIYSRQPVHGMYLQQYDPSIVSPPLGYYHPASQEFVQLPVRYIPPGQPSSPFPSPTQPVQELDSTLVDPPLGVVTNPQEMPMPKSNFPKAF